MKTLVYTHHCQIRMAQRGITKEHVAAVLKYGRFIYRQGLNPDYSPGILTSTKQTDK